MSDIQEHLREAMSRIAWTCAADPSHAQSLRQWVGSTRGPETYVTVFNEFGPKAATAWEDGVRARKAFFEAVGEKDQGKPADTTLSEVEEIFHTLVKFRNDQSDKQDYEVLEKAIEALRQHSLLKAKREDAMKWLSENS